MGYSSQRQEEWVCYSGWHLELCKVAGCSLVHICECHLLWAECMVMGCQAWQWYGVCQCVLDRSSMARLLYHLTMSNKPPMTNQHINTIHLSQQTTTGMLAMCILLPIHLYATHTCNFSWQGILWHYYIHKWRFLVFTIFQSTFTRSPSEKKW